VLTMLESTIRSMESVLVIDSAAANAATGEIGRDLARQPAHSGMGWMVRECKGEIAVLSSVEDPPNHFPQRAAPVRSHGGT
jgi:N-acetylglutamate synthase/N-acetylornithine aminotransferase